MTFLIDSFFISTSPVVFLFVASNIKFKNFYAQRIKAFPLFMQYKETLLRLRIVS